MYQYNRNRIDITLIYQYFCELLYTAKNTVISLNFLVWNLVERHNFRIVSGDSPETMRKLCLSTKLQHQEIKWNYGIFRSANLQKFHRKLVISIAPKDFWEGIAKNW